MYKHTPARRHASFGAPKLAIRTTPGKSVRPTIVIVCMRAPERLFFLDFFLNHLISLALPVCTRQNDARYLSLSQSIFVSVCQVFSRKEPIF